VLKQLYYLCETCRPSFGLVLVKLLFQDTIWPLIVLEYCGIGYGMQRSQYMICFLWREFFFSAFFWFPAVPNHRIPAHTFYRLCRRLGYQNRPPNIRDIATWIWYVFYENTSIFAFLISFLQFQLQVHYGIHYIHFATDCASWIAHQMSRIV